MSVNDSEDEKLLYFFTFTGMMERYFETAKKRGGSVNTEGICDTCKEELDTLISMMKCQPAFKKIEAPTAVEHICYELLEPYVFSLCTEMDRNTTMFYWGTTVETRKELFKQCGSDFFMFIYMNSDAIEVALKDANGIARFGMNRGIMDRLIDLDKKQKSNATVDALQRVLRQPNINDDDMNRAITGLECDVVLFLPQIMFILNEEEAASQTNNLHIVKHQLNAISGGKVEIGIYASNATSQIKPRNHICKMNVEVATRLAHSKIYNVSAGVFKFDDVNISRGDFRSMRMDHVVYRHNVHKHNMADLIHKIAPPVHKLYLKGSKNNNQDEIIKHGDLGYKVSYDYNLICETDTINSTLSTIEPDAAVELLLLYASLHDDTQTLSAVLDNVTFRKTKLAGPLDYYVKVKNQLNTIYRKSDNADQTYIFFKCPYQLMASKTNVVEKYNKLLDSIPESKDFRLINGTLNEITEIIKKNVVARVITEVFTFYDTSFTKKDYQQNVAKLCDSLDVDKQAVTTVLYHKRNENNALHNMYLFIEYIGPSSACYFRSRMIDDKTPDEYVNQMDSSIKKYEENLPEAIFSLSIQQPPEPVASGVQPSPAPGGSEVQVSTKSKNSKAVQNSSKSTSKSTMTWNRNIVSVNLLADIIDNIHPADVKYIIYKLNITYPIGQFVYFACVIPPKVVNNDADQWVPYMFDEPFSVPIWNYTDNMNRPRRIMLTERFCEQERYCSMAYRGLKDHHNGEIITDKEFMKLEFNKNEHFDTRKKKYEDIWKECIRLFWSWPLFDHACVDRAFALEMHKAESAVEFIRLINITTGFKTAIVWTGLHRDIFPMSLRNPDTRKILPCDRRVRLSIQAATTKLNTKDTFLPIYCGRVQNQCILSHKQRHYEGFERTKTDVCIVAYTNLEPDVFRIFMSGVVYLKTVGYFNEKAYIDICGTFLLSLYEYVQYVNEETGLLIIVLLNKHADMVKDHFYNNEYNVQIEIQREEHETLFIVQASQLLELYKSNNVNEKQIENYRYKVNDARLKYNIELNIGKKRWGIEIAKSLSHNWQFTL
jgi:hypothetical protein